MTYCKISQWNSEQSQSLSVNVLFQETITVRRGFRNHIFKQPVFGLVIGIWLQFLLIVRSLCSFVVVHRVCDVTIVGITWLIVRIFQVWVTVIMIVFTWWLVVINHWWVSGSTSSCCGLCFIGPMPTIIITFVTGSCSHNVIDFRFIRTGRTW